MSNTYEACIAEHAKNGNRKTIRPSSRDVFQMSMHEERPGLGLTNESASSPRDIASADFRHISDESSSVKGKNESRFWGRNEVKAEFAPLSSTIAARSQNFSKNMGISLKARAR
jgi:hypothetical protein